MVIGDNRFVPLLGMEQCHCLPGEPGSWSPCLGNRGGTPDLLHCLQQQSLGERNERKKAHSGEKAEVPVSLSSQLAGHMGLFELTGSGPMAPSCGL